MKAGFYTLPDSCIPVFLKPLRHFSCLVLSRNGNVRANQEDSGRECGEEWDTSVPDITLTGEECSQPGRRQLQVHDRRRCHTVWRDADERQGVCQLTRVIGKNVGSDTTGTLYLRQGTQMQHVRLYATYSIIPCHVSASPVLPTLAGRCDCINLWRTAWRIFI